MARSFSRFFAVLVVVESLTFGMTVLLLDYGVRQWTGHKAGELATLAPKVARTFEDWDLARLKQEGVKSSEYRRCLQALVEQEKAYYPKGGCTFALFDVRQGTRGPWLALLVGETPPYDPTVPSVEPEGTASLPVSKAAQGEVSYTTTPTGEFGYQYGLSAYAPVRDRDGKVQAVLAIDYDVSSLNDLRDVVKTAFIWAVLPATMLSAIVACFLASRFVEPFDFLRQVYSRVQSSAGSGSPLPEAIPAKLPSPAPPVAAAGQEPQENLKTETAEPPVSPGRGTDGAPRTLQQDEDPSWKSLTSREKEVLLCVGQGLTNKKIAESLYVTEETVKKHMKNIFPKLNVKNRTEAALFAISKGAMGWTPGKGHLEEGG